MYASKFPFVILLASYALFPQFLSIQKNITPPTNELMGKLNFLTMR
jgi:hypothetical protein